MRKAVFTLNINDEYSPEIRSVTYPLMKHWAHKIGAEFIEITERKFPDFPPAYEKLQIHELGRVFDWSIFMDADTLVYPDCPDWTALLEKDTVACYGFDWAPIRWSMDEYFQRNGRMIGWANWLAIASDWCLDLWRPLEMSAEEAAARIHPTVKECQRKLTPDHLIDDYALSRNVARFGLKAVAILELMGKYSQQGVWYIHNYEVPHDEKAAYLRDVLSKDREVKDPDTGITRRIPGWKIPSSMLSLGERSA